jgi:asparagine synthase (glutamine-hydrolysing)
MRHRGPDDAGIESFGPATLGMRRLAIFDPKHGHQPMHTPDGRFHLIFNGSIFNFKELRAELSSKGHAFHTDCDTEVLLAALAEHGEGTLLKLRGMFAFALWDTQEQSLFFARDPFGIKPFYFAPPTAATGNLFVFASELRALLASGCVADEIDPAAVSDSLAYLAVPAPRTFYRAARCLRPGECGYWRNGQIEVRSYWEFPRGPVHRVSQSREEFIRELRTKLEDSVRAHLLADVPVGAFLSGGLDSNVVVGLMSRQAARLKTFSIGFAEAGYSEANEAAEAAAHFGTEHHAHVLTGEQVAADIEKILASFDQPTGDAINTYYVSQYARAGGVTVALSGLGGDELFGGYPWFRQTPRLARAVKIWRVLPGFVRHAWLNQLRHGDMRQRKLADVLAHAKNLHEVAALQRRHFSETQRRELLLNSEAFTTHPELTSLAQQIPASDPFRVVSAWELRGYMADVLLRDSDVMSMRHSLELRVPLVDRPLIEWLWSQPDSFKSSGTQPKAALAEAVADILPPKLAERPKRGFTLPFSVWMRGPLKPFLEETFSTTSLERSGFLNTTAVQALWQKFLRENDPRAWSRLWSLAILTAFLGRSRALRQ